MRNITVSEVKYLIFSFRSIQQQIVSFTPLDNSYFRNPFIVFTFLIVRNQTDNNCILVSLFPCFLGPLAPRRAVGARFDGLPRQFSPLLPVV